MGGPSGGDGGEGGSVWLVGENSRNTLFHLRFRQLYSAERGRHGEGSNRTGRSGEDLEIPVPLGTQVFDAEGDRLLGEILADGERLLVAAGGAGGRGNARFKSATNQAPRRADPGGDPEERTLRLELKLLADVGLVGLPNAGKSTLISRLSAARPKIADYPFTTLVPQLGVVDLGIERGTFVIADLPGLIAGAAEGAGLGHQFLRHVERCRVLLHLVDLSPAPDGETAPAELAVVEGELAAFDPDLLTRPRVVVGSKVDVALSPEEGERRGELAAAAEERGLPYLEVSAATGAGLPELVALAVDLLATAQKEEELADRAGDPFGALDAVALRGVRLKLGLFGGSFDPVHNGHLRPVREARRALGLDRVLFLPTANPPHKRAAEDAPGAPALARYAMVEIALLDEDGLYADAHELLPGRPSYTVETLEHFRAARPADELFLLIGSDSLAELPTWKRWEELPELARLVVLARPGGRLEEIGERLAPSLAERLERDEITVIKDALVDLSSTEIRNRLARGEPLDEGWLPPRVVDYIYKYCLYS